MRRHNSRKITIFTSPRVGFVARLTIMPTISSLQWIISTALYFHQVHWMRCRPSQCLSVTPAGATVSVGVLPGMRGHKIVSHGGGLPGIATNALMIPTEQLGVVVLTNLGGGSAREIAGQLANSVLGTSILRSTLEDPLPINTRYPLPDADILAQYVGTYTWAYANEEYRVTVEMKAGKLTIQYDDEDPTPFIAIGPDIFISDRWGAIIHFVRDRERNVNGLVSAGGGLYQ